MENWRLTAPGKVKIFGWRESCTDGYIPCRTVAKHRLLSNFLTRRRGYKACVVHVSKSKNSLDSFRHIEQGGGDLEGRHIGIHCNLRSFVNGWHFIGDEWYESCGAHSF